MIASGGLARRRVLGGALGLLAAPALIGRATAEDFVIPSLAIDLLVGGPAGSTPDQGARAFIPFLERHLPGARVTAVNLAGDVGLRALRALAAATPDGRTLGWVSAPALAARAVDHRGAEGLLASIALVGGVEREPIAIVSQADGPLASVRELIARSSENASAMPLGTPPTGSAPHLAALRLQAVSDTPLNIVAFPSAAAARQAAIAGNVTAALLAMGDVVECLRAGRLTGLGIAAGRRANGFPDMEPLRDAGLALSAPIQRGIAAPLFCPEPVVARLTSALEAVVADSEFTAQGDNSGFRPLWMPGPAWTTQLGQDRAAMAQLWSREEWLAVGLG